MAWTYEQQMAIDARNSNLLVSAAAGSGKTAVLVERIINRVLDKDNPVDIDSIMVVTFTKAAAGEMKTRLLNAFEKVLKDMPGNRHLIRQLALVDNAQISTIDSFCYDVVKNYYNTIELDPNIRIADDGELSLIKEDVFGEILEEYFQKNDKEFIDFVEAYAPGKTVSGLSEIVMGLYRFAQSNPWPMEWLEDCIKQYEVTTKEEFENLPMVKFIADHLRIICREYIEECKYIISCCNETSGPAEYIPTIEADIALWETASKGKNYFEILLALENEFGRLPNSKKCDADIKKEVQDIRNRYKDSKKKLLKDFSSDVNEQLEEMKLLAPFVKVLVELTMDFSNRYLAYKQSKNIADFSDVEHYALDILLKKEGDKITFTEVADELAMGYTELYIDEYQDSNLVQEYLLTAVSKERFGEPNIFMVGDVKQSIYKFRMARPELFMDKYNSYSDYSENSHEKYHKIQLQKNFRSRENVLESINDVFKKAMHESLGGIEYTDEVRLNYGGDSTEEINDKTELILIEEDELSYIDVDKTTAAAHIAAKRIKELMAEDVKLEYKDFAILLRSDKTAGPVYSSVLAEHGIPCVYNSATGYFSNYEVVNVLDLLNVIDNPRQEIPLAGVMRSYFSYFTVEEMAQIKGRGRKTELYDCVVQYAKKDTELGKKCQELLDFIAKYKEKVGIYSIRDILSDIIYNTGYYDYICAIPGGELKKANLDMLVHKATQYEKTSYLGLFNFLRYIEKLQKYDVDYGEGGVTESEANQVRIMSIHKSKGLEFPIVIVGEFGKKYNLRDTSTGIIYDNTYGIGMDYVDLKYRVKAKTGYKVMVGKKLSIDAIGEELRILYVAMTRAVNKLIMIGKEKVEDSIPKWERISHEEILNVNYLMENTRYSAVVAPCAINNSRFNCQFVSGNDIEKIMSEVFVDSSTEITDRILEISDIDINEKDLADIKEILEYEYPHTKILNLKSKYSVSDLKHQAMEDSELLEEQFKFSKPRKTVPAFLEEEETEMGGILRGNAYHKVFEILDYGVNATVEDVNAFLEASVEAGRLTEEYKELVKPDKIVRFINSSIGREMKDAFMADILYREQPFIMEVGANEVDDDYPEDERVLIQGIVDAFYIKDDKVYIVDYKTDSVPMDTGETILIERYKRQLKLYAYALEKILNKKVEKTSLYSVALGKEVEIV